MPRALEAGGRAFGRRTLSLSRPRRRSPRAIASLRRTRSAPQSFIVRDGSRLEAAGSMVARWEISQTRARASHDIRPEYDRTSATRCRREGCMHGRTPTKWSTHHNHSTDVSQAGPPSRQSQAHKRCTPDAVGQCSTLRSVHEPKPRRVRACAWVSIEWPPAYSRPVGQLQVRALIVFCPSGANLCCLTCRLLCWVGCCFVSCRLLLHAFCGG
jgi:hypothetical protein